MLLLPGLTVTTRTTLWMLGIPCIDFRFHDCIVGRASEDIWRYTVLRNRWFTYLGLKDLIVRNKISSNVKQKNLPRRLLVQSQFWFSRSQTVSEASTWATVYLNLNNYIYVIYVFRFQNHCVFLHVFWCSEELPSWNHRSISRWPGLPSRPRGWSGCCECWRLKFGSQNISSWWFQPSWKTCSSNCIMKPQGSGWTLKNRWNHHLDLRIVSHVLHVWNIHQAISPCSCGHF